jgi:hypothetical protein
LLIENNQPGAVGGLRRLLCQGENQAQETNEKESNAQVINHSKTDVFARIDGHERPQEPAFSFHMNESFRHFKKMQHKSCQPESEHETELIVSRIVPESYTDWTQESSARRKRKEKAF